MPRRGVEGLRDDRLVPLTLLDPGLIARLHRLELTYDEAGQTRGFLPAGYRHLRRRAVIGSGPQVFAAAVTMLLGWQVHLRAGLRVSPSSATAGPGAVVVLDLGAGPVRVTAPCRVVYTVNEPDRQGFAYGTLPGHPECGEEARSSLSGTTTVPSPSPSPRSPGQRRCGPRPPVRPEEPSSGTSPRATCAHWPTERGRQR
jgi:uncharacterized protein (UPF0548 family)